jgi:hypothetical protein
MSRLSLISVGTLSVASAIAAATLGGYALGHPDTPTAAPVTSQAPGPMCAMKNGDILIRGNAGWMYLPDVVVNAIPSTLPTCDPSAYATPVKPAVPGVEPTDILKTVLPYYGKVAPDWCAEDQVCWIGSKADGRSATEVLESLSDDIISSSQAYAYGDASDTSPGKE